MSNDRFYNFETRKWSKKKITLDDWTRKQLPRPLSPTEHAIFKRGQEEGYEQGRLVGLEQGRREAKAEFAAQRMEARIKLMNAAGQAYDAISRTLHPDGAFGKLDI